MRTRYLGLLCLLVLTTATAPASAVTPIGTLRCDDATGIPLLNHQTETVRGIVTLDYYTGTNTRLYIQDATGGINVYGPPLYCGNLGDDITVTGVIQAFNGLTELDSVITVTLNSPGNPQPTPLPLTIAMANATFQADNCEPNESRLVHLANVLIRTTAGAMPPATYTNNINLHLENNGPDSTTNWIVMFVPANGPNCGVDPMIGQPILKTVCGVVGVLSQFKSSSPYTSGYEIIPRTTADVRSGETVPVKNSTWGELRRLYR